MTIVVDSSAIIAVVLNEPGWEQVAPRLQDARISAVNVSEVIAKLIERGWVPDVAVERVLRSGAIPVEFDTRQAIEAGALRAPTRSRGLSLGDRACLALGMAVNARVLTADRAWAGLEVGVEIEVIR